MQKYKTNKFTVC